MKSIFAAFIGITLSLVCANAVADNKDTPPATPDMASKLFLRLETGRHTAPVRTLSVASNGLFVTGSDDKTVRLWAPNNDREAVRIIRLPIASGTEGQVRAVAISPDGRQLIATGLTGSTWNGPGKYSLNMFDLTNDGQELRRLPGLPEPANVVVFDKTGERIYAGFSENGISAWSISGRRLKDDHTIKGSVTSIDTAQDGKVAAVSLDGSLRLYDADLKLIKAIPLKAKPMSVAFSPDSGLIAVGTADSGVHVFSSDGLNSVRQIKQPKGIVGDFAAVAWARIGGGVHLLASGSSGTSDRDISIFGWGDMGFGNEYSIPASRDRIIAIKPLPGGGAAFIGAAPVVGQIGADGKLAFAHNGDQLDFRDIHRGRFGVSDDGLTIEFGTDIGGVRPLRFTLEQSGGTLEEAGELSSVTQVRRESSAIPLTDWWNNTSRPKLGKIALDVPVNETTRSFSPLFDDSGFLLGTNNRLILFSAKGELQKSVATTSTVWGVMTAPKAQIAILALGDGTIRWYSLRKENLLEPLGALFVHPDRKRWIAWNPEGIFAQSSFGGNDLVGYAKSEGEKRQPEWISFAQLFRIFYNPQLLYNSIADRTQVIEDIKKIVNSANPEKIDPPQVTLAEMCFDLPNGQNARTRDVLRAAESRPESTMVAEQKAETCHPFQEIKTRSVRRTDVAIASAGGGAPSGTAAIGQVIIPPGVASVRFRIQATLGAGQTIRELDVFVNNRNIGRSLTRSFRRLPTAATAGDASPSLSKAGEFTFETTREVPLDAGANSIQVRAYSSNHLYGTAEAEIFRTLPESTLNSGLPTLHVLAIGVNKYKDPQVNKLEYAVADARDVANKVANGGKKIYGDVKIVTIFDEAVTDDGVRNAFYNLSKNAKPEDAVVIYLSGHGDNQKSEEKDTYVFLHHETSTKDIVGSSITAGTLVKYISDIQARNLVLFLDTCYSGAFNTAFDPGAALSEETGRILITAASSVETALDNLPGTKNGAFAHIALEGLSGKAALRDDDNVDAIGLSQYLIKNVAKIAKSKKNHQQHVTSHQRSSTAFPLIAVGQ